MGFLKDGQLLIEPLGRIDFGHANAVRMVYFKAGSLPHKDMKVQVYFEPDPRTGGVAFSVYVTKPKKKRKRLKSKRKP